MKKKGLLQVQTLKCKQKLSKNFDLASKFAKIWKFKIFENFRKKIFPLFLKITTFTKTAVKFRVLKIFSPIFFAKYEWNVDMKNV
jgi:hypothetical protein